MISWALQEISRLHETTLSLYGMEQHGVRAYLSFSKTPTLVGTGLLLLSGRWKLSTMVSVGTDSSNVGLPVPAVPEFFRLRWVVFAILPYPPFGGGDRRSFMDAFPPLLLRSLVCGLFV